MTIAENVVAVVTRQQGAARIEGVQRLQWGVGRENTFINSLLVTLTALGEQTTYPELMGLSGAAFRLQFHQPQWCPSSPDATCGFDCSWPALKAFGFDYAVRHVNPDDADQVKKARSDIVHAIDRGLPVPAIHLVKAPDWGVVVGYRDSGATLLCRDYHAGGDDYVAAERFPTALLLLRTRSRPPARQASVARSLRLAAGLVKTLSYDNYTCGLNAYERWAADLCDEARFGCPPGDPEQLGQLMQINHWVYLTLVDARRAAFEYLGGLVNELPAPAGEHIAAAADLYRRLVSDVLGKRSPAHVAPMPTQSKKGQNWTADQRQTQARLLREAADLERQAVAEVEKAITVLNAKPPTAR